MPRRISAPRTPQNRTRCCCSSGTAKIVEDHEEDEKIVDAERKFQNVTGDELQRDLVSLPEVKQDRERGRQRNVDRAPTQRRAKADNPARPMEDAKIQHQHAEREKVEENPEIEQWEFLAAKNC